MKTIDQLIEKKARELSDKQLRKSIVKITGEGPFDSRDVVTLDVEKVITELYGLKHECGGSQVPFSSFLKPLEEAAWQEHKQQYIDHVAEEFFTNVMEREVA